MDAAKEIKLKLFNHCTAYVANHVEIINGALSEAQSAVNSETKNTAGDRYETERAMKQRETEMYGNHLEEALKQQLLLEKIDISRQFASVEPGALVATSIGYFFIAISADELVIDDKEYSIISPESPIGQAMLNKTAGTQFFFRSKAISILDVC